MRRIFIIVLFSLLFVFLGSACGTGVVDSPTTVPTMSNDQLGTRAAQTAYADLSQATPIEPSATPIENTPRPTDTETPPMPTATQGATAIPTIDIFGSGQTTIRDDFESLSGWYTGSSDTFLVEFLEGGYHIVVDMITGSDPVYSIRQTGLDDIIIGVDAMRFDGKDGSYFGVVCRYVNSANYYRFVIYTEGEYEIAKKVNGVFTSLIREELDKPLLTEGKPNNISANCVGESLKLYLNEKMVADIVDSDLISGYVGLIAGTDLQPGLDILFDNFIFSKP